MFGLMIDSTYDHIQRIENCWECYARQDGKLLGCPVWRKDTRKRELRMRTIAFLLEPKHCWK